MHPTAKPGSRRILALALIALTIPGILALAAPTAEAGHGPKRRSDRIAAVHAHARQEAGRDGSDRCAPRVIAPACRPARRADPAPVIVWKHHRFVWHGGSGIYVNGPRWAFAILDGPLPGCAYIDPLCHRTFTSVDTYRAHLRHHPHAPLLEVAIRFD